MCGYVSLCVCISHLRVYHLLVLLLLDAVHGRLNMNRKTDSWQEKRVFLMAQAAIPKLNKTLMVPHSSDHKRPGIERIDPPRNIQAMAREGAELLLHFYGLTSWLRVLISCPRPPTL